MGYTVNISNRFKKDFRRCIKRGLDMKLITDAMDILAATGSLPLKYHPTSWSVRSRKHGNAIFSQTG